MSRHAAPLHGIWHGEPPDLGEPSAGLESRRRRALRRARVRGRRRGRATSRAVSVVVALAVLLVGAAGCRTTGSGAPPGVPCESRFPGECAKGHWTASCDCAFTREECASECGALVPHWIPPDGCTCT